MLSPILHLKSSTQGIPFQIAPENKKIYEIQKWVLYISSKDIYMFNILDV